MLTIWPAQSALALKLCVHLCMAAALAAAGLTRALLASCMQCLAAVMWCCPCTPCARLPYHCLAARWALLLRPCSVVSSCRLVYHAGKPTSSNLWASKLDWAQLVLGWNLKCCSVLWIVSLSQKGQLSCVLPILLLLGCNSSHVALRPVDPICTVCVCVAVQPEAVTVVMEGNHPSSSGPAQVACHPSTACCTEQCLTKLLCGAMLAFRLCAEHSCSRAYSHDTVVQERLSGTWRMCIHCTLSPGHICCCQILIALKLLGL